MAWVGTHALAVPADQSSRLLPICHLHECLHPVQMQCWVRASSVPHTCTLSLATTVFALVGSCALEQWGLERSSAWSRVHAGAVSGNWPGSQAVSIFFLHHALGASNCVHALHGWNPSFSQPPSPPPPLPISLIFKTSQEDSSSQCQTSQLGCPVSGSNCSLPREDLQACVIIPLLCPFLAVQVLT